MKDSAAFNLPDSPPEAGSWRRKQLSQHGGIPNSDALWTVKSSRPHRFTVGTARPWLTSLLHWRSIAIKTSIYKSLRSDNLTEFYLRTSPPVFLSTFAHISMPVTTNSLNPECKNKQKDSFFYHTRLPFQWDFDYSICYRKHGTISGLLFHCHLLIRLLLSSPILSSSGLTNFDNFLFRILKFYWCLGAV